MLSRLRTPAQSLNTSHMLQMALCAGGMNVSNTHDSSEQSFCLSSDYKHGNALFCAVLDQNLHPVCWHLQLHLMQEAEDLPSKEVANLYNSEERILSYDAQCLHALLVK
ncbi:hypothetical protein BaRGS_00027478 [Batillaria attramentaria]|uniref:Uncharacterized protein n=1 Tax=Batillaria attramentaria TaxID=370345 RepID=A0ABD0K252_9CAEN